MDHICCCASLNGRSWLGRLLRRTNAVCPAVRRLHLEHRLINHCRWIGIERENVDVVDHSDNRKQSAISPEESLADRIGAIEVLARHGRTDDGHQGRLRVVLLAEGAALAKADAHGVKVARRHQRVLREVEVGGRGMFQAKADTAVVAEWQMAGSGHRRHSRQT